MNYINKRLNLTAEPANSLTLHYKVMIGGSFNLIHKSLIEGSADWQAKPDWVITAFRDKGEIHKLVDFKTDFPYQAMGGDMVLSYDYAISTGKEIFSVRRSDGVEFKVGDITNKGLITAFRKVNNDMMAAFENDLRRSHIEDIEPAPTVLFTTHDGVEITDGETVVYCVEHRNDYNIETLKSGDANLQVDGKWFSTRKAAVLYISENKPLYSIADIRKAWGEYSYLDADNFIELLKQV